MKKIPQIEEAAHAIHEGLSQHLLGTLLAAHTLSASLRKGKSKKATEEAEKLVELLKDADKQLRNILSTLEGGKTR